MFLIYAEFLIDITVVTPNLDQIPPKKLYFFNPLVHSAHKSARIAKISI